MISIRKNVTIHIELHGDEACTKIQQIYTEYGVGIFDSNLPQFKYPLARNQRNIAFALRIIAIITIVCGSYLEIRYEMTFGLWMVTIVGWLSGIVTGTTVVIKAYDVEKALDDNKSESETMKICKKGRVYGIGLLAPSLVIVLTMTYCDIPIS